VANDLYSENRKDVKEVSKLRPGHLVKIKGRVTGILEKVDVVLPVLDRSVIVKETG
jgi:hypothetical protein